MATMINNINSNFNVNFDALRPLSIFNQNRLANQREIQRASTATLNDNAAIDNVSAYSLSESLRIRTRMLDQANQNIQNDTALLKTAQGRGDSIVESIKEIQQLAFTATEESLTDEDRLVIQRDINRLVNQISADSQITFNGRKLIDGSSSTGNPATATVLSNDSLYRGTSASTALTALQNSSGANLGIEASDRITASYVQNGNIYTTSFTVGNNTLEDIFVNLNKINGVTLTDSAFVGGGRKTLTEPVEPIKPEAQKIYSPEEISRPAEVLEPDEVSKPLIPTEKYLEPPRDEAVVSAREEIETAINTFGENLSEVIDDEIISSLQNEMRTTQNVFDDWKDTETYQALSDEVKENFTTETDAALNAALNESEYADKVAAYNEAATQYEIERTIYNAIQEGENVEVIDESDTRYEEAVENYDAQGTANQIAAYKQYQIDKAAYEQYQSELTTYNQYLEYKTDYDSKRATYGATYEKYGQRLEAETVSLADYESKMADYENNLYPTYVANMEQYTEDYAQYQEDLANYNSMAVDIVRPDSNGLSVTARKPGLDEQISGVSINVADSSGNTKSFATAALNNFKTTTYADDEREDNSVNFQIGETIDQTMNFGFNDMRAEAFGLKGSDGKIISISTKADADAALATIDNALTKATEQLQTIGSSEKRLGYIADSLAIEIGNIQEPDLMVRNAGMAKTLTVYALDFFQRDRMQSMFAVANQHSSAVFSLLR